MNRIADTHVLLWLAYQPEQLSARARAALGDSSITAVFFSLASIWEIAIKQSINKLRLPVPLGDFVADLRKAGFRYLPIDAPDAFRIAELPLHHRDPFDRMLVAQAQQRELGLISGDPMLAPYGVDVLW